MAAEPAPRIRVAELFAGVGGFRLGLEGAPSEEWETDLLKVGDTGFDVIWSNQWEPTPKPKRGKKRRKGKQWASEIYVERFGEDGHTNEDIHEFTHRRDSVSAIPEHDLLVGGFPCQDYSVARTVSGEMGIAGEKGKLWEPIRKVISYMHLNRTRSRPEVVLLENVPRLLNSPANARGLNFAKILYDLLKIGYNVEWRVINSSDYGMSQQRKRVFILAYRWPGGGIQKSINGPKYFNARNRNQGPLSRWMFGDHSGYTRKDWAVGPLGEAFPAEGEEITHMALPDIDYWTAKTSKFGNAGYAWDGRFGGKTWVKQFRSWKVKPIKEDSGTIRGILSDEYPEDYEVDPDGEAYRRFDYAKGPLDEYRIRKEDRERAEEVPVGDSNLWDVYQDCTHGYSRELWKEHSPTFEEHIESGIVYRYQGGPIAFPDPLDKPSRTIVTGEIGKSVSRSRHIIRLDDGTVRRLVPLELERLNQFPDGWTDFGGIKDSKRGFLMGNALVTGIIHRLSGPLGNLIHSRREEG